MNQHDESAFPFQLLDRHGQPTHEGCVGMSLWDYFAAAALTGIAAHGCLMPNEHEEIARRAAAVADAMMAERTKRSSAPPKGDTSRG